MVIAVGGENLIDFVQENEDRVPPAYVAHPGGSPMNVAMALSRQGADVHYLSPVSQDALGQLIATRLEADGVTLATPRVPQPTSLAVVSLTDGAATYEFYRDNTAERQISADQLEAASPNGMRAFHVGSAALVSGQDAAVWEAFHAQCHAAGILTCYDPNARPSLTPDRDDFVARVERMSRHTDVLKLSDEDLGWLYPDTPLDVAFDALVSSSGAPLVVLTRGPDGAWARAGQARASVAAPTVDPLVDTVGAGDTFMATLIRQVVDRDGDTQFDDAGLARLLTTAAQAAAINCTRAGCQPPTRPELELALSA
ncbi:MAG: carbohydrate kinase [Pseudomonadota bacterium]